MATFYQGYRNVLRGRDADNFIHTWKGRVGTYSNWSLMDTGGAILSGAPDNQYEIGNYKHSTLLQYIYAGKHHIPPMQDPGSGARLAYHRTHPWEYKGLSSAQIFGLGYGHQDRVTSYSLYSNFVFDGLPSVEALKDPGHVLRYNAPYGGAFNPWENKGVSTGPLNNPGSALPSGYDNSYGKNKVNEWRGIPSSRALF